MMDQRPFVVVTSAERTFLAQKLLARRRPLTSFSGRGRGGWGVGIAVDFSCFLFLAARLLPEIERTSDLRGARNSLRGFGAAIEGFAVAVEVMIIVTNSRRMKERLCEWWRPNELGVASLPGSCLKRLGGRKVREKFRDPTTDDSGSPATGGRNQPAACLL